MIATDEAGYGPKLGPLVVCASTWKLPDSAEGSDESVLNDLFSPLQKPMNIWGVSVWVGDSKAIFKPASSKRPKLTEEPSPYAALELATSAGLLWIRSNSSETVDVGELIDAQDIADLNRCRWLRKLPSTRLNLACAGDIATAWSSGSPELIGLKARVITASRFNAICDKGWNKSDLLSSVTLQLIREQLKTLPAPQTPVQVRCDRHGGRRYYSGPIQSVFPETLAEVISEGSHESIYEVDCQPTPFEIRFTVKGDRFAPVSYSSMVAKFLREKSMEQFNLFFAKESANSVKPTAGYPQDAARYLKEMKPTLDLLNIDMSDLIRTR
ncbi:MAG: hypothetical protein AAF802_25565 [Planctomycetota bacterium]